MDPKDHSPRMMAPGAGSGTAMRLPEPSGRRWPALDDHFSEPEVSREEWVDGERMWASPAKPPHADRHFQLDYLIGAHLKPGFVGATDLMTRVTERSDFATDTAIRRAGTDPETDERYLEELVFEVVDKRAKKDVDHRARELRQRGVRRQIAVFVDKGEVCEWSDDGWRRLDPKTTLRDPCLVRPLRVRALLEAAEADNAVARALLAKRNPVLREREERSRHEGEREGELRGKAEMLLTLLEARGLPLDETARSRILECTDSATLECWGRKAVSITTVDALFVNADS